MLPVIKSDHGERSRPRQRSLRSVAGTMRTRLTKDRVVGIHGHLVLGRIADQTLRLRESHIAGRGSIALVVGDDLHLAMLKDTDTRVRGTKINANRW